MRLRQVRDFIAVVECGGIRAAARKLGVSQPTLSKSIRSLESELHAVLLVRSPSGIVPTTLGRAFFARAHAAQSELRKAEEEVAQLARTNGASVAFGVGPIAAMIVLPQAMKRFREDFPSLPVRIVEGLAQLLLPSVRDESLDFVMGFRTEAGLDASLRFRPLYRSELAVVARKGHVLRGARSLAELADASWLSTPRIGAPGGPLERSFASSGLLPPKPSVQCESFNTVVALLANSDMLTLMQRRLLKQPFARDFLQEIAVAEPVPALTVGIYMRAGIPLTRPASAMVRAFVAASRALVRAG